MWCLWWVFVRGWALFDQGLTGAGADGVKARSRQWHVGPGNEGRDLLWAQGVRAWQRLMLVVGFIWGLAWLVHLPAPHSPPPPHLPTSSPLHLPLPPPTPSSPLLLFSTPLQVMPFVTSNIAKNNGPEDWRWREAATFAFGSVMEGPSPASLVPLVQQALPFLLQVRGFKGYEGR